MPYSISSRKISIFLSSTFKDMQAERTYLVKYIFPHIKRECLKRNIEFSVIDLRWGLVYENEGSIIGTCLDLIDKTNPFFIGLLGDRFHRNVLHIHPNSKIGGVWSPINFQSIFQ